MEKSGSWFTVAKMYEKQLKEKEVHLNIEILKHWNIEIPKALKYCVGVQWDQSYIMGRRCFFRLGWPPF